MTPRRLIRTGRRIALRFLQLQYAKAAIWTERTVPDFLCIGAPRTATTWLYHQLRNHPEFYLPRIKELRFFDEPVDFGYSDRTGLLWQETFFFDMHCAAHWRWYWRQFAPANGRICGEITPAYSALSRERVTLIKSSLPQLKVIYMLRNPVDIVWSTIRKVVWYDFGRDSTGNYPDDVLLEAALNPANLRWGTFRNNIQTWENAFGREQMHYIFFDDLNRSSTDELNRLCEFLCASRLSEDATKMARRRVNVAPRQGMPEAIREALSTYFSDTIAFMEQHFQRDLGHWLDVPTRECCKQ